MASLTNQMNAFAGMTPEEIDIARQQRLADMLTKQSQEPLNGQMVSGHFVAPSWTQQLAKVLSGYMAGRATSQADTMQKQLGEKQRADFMDTAQKYAAALKGTPEQVGQYQADNPFGEDLGKLQTVTPAVPGSRDAAMNVAMHSNSPLWQQLAMKDAMTPDKPVVVGRSLVDPNTGKVLATDSTWAAEQQAARQAKQDELQAKIEDARLSRQERADLQRELAQLRTSQGSQPYFQFIGTPQGIVTGNARTGQLSLGSINGAPVVKSSDSPQLQGNITQAKHAGGAMGDAQGTLASAQASLPQVENTVNQLKEIGKDATYTYAGRARDAVARQVGIATPGAVAREKYIQTVRDVLFPQLRATFGAQFTVKEGEALVATLGDPNKTPAERNAALDAFIDQKKQHIQSLQRQTGQSQAQPASTVRRYNPQTGRIE